MFFSRAKKLAPAAGAHERRRSIRHATVMQIAKLRLASGQEELCLLRDVSPEGLKAEIYIDVAVGERIGIELRTGHRVSGAVAWTDGRMTGLVFDQVEPLSAMLAHCSFDDRLGKLRPPRLMVDMPGKLRIDFVEQDVRIGNISQAGLQIDAPDPFDPNTPCAITLPGLSPRPATIRWCRDGQAGLLLGMPFDYIAFAEWRSALAKA